MEAVARFITHVEGLRKANGYQKIFVMDETTVWFDCPGNTSIETRGVKEVRVCYGVL